MAKQFSTMLPLGTTAIPFILQNAMTNKPMSLDDFRSKPLCVIMFICNHCPYVQLINPVLVSLTNEYSKKEVAFIAINSNDIARYPDDSPEKMKALGLDLGFPFPYLFDETQEIAKAYKAACTPDFYLFDDNRKLIYRGQFDDARPGNGIEVTGKSLREALDAALKGNPISEEQKPSLGCGIKWKEVIS